MTAINLTTQANDSTKQDNIITKSIDISKNYTNSPETASSANACSGNRYGANCTEACPSNCGGDKNCDSATGDCLSGCIPGYYRGKCDEECVNCATKACNQKTRQCIEGCLPGYSGISCSEKAASNTLHYILLALLLSLVLIVFAWVGYKYRRHRSRVRLNREMRLIEQANENMDNVDFLVARLSLFQSPKDNVQGGKGEAEEEDDNED